MTIREIEERSGMTRANIRFYEAEGLLCPARGENGYRDYSEADLAALRRIRLLRMLHVPLDDIRALQRGEAELPQTLARQAEMLGRERGALERAEAVCREISGDGVDYAALDAEKYLTLLTAPDPQALSGDVLPRVQSPLRRLLARLTDLHLYSTLGSVFLMLVCNVNASARGTGGDLLDALAAVLLMLFLEPLLLRLCGTTPGKWLFGLSVTDEDGARLTYRAGLERTWLVFWRGMGLNIPIYHLIRLWKSCDACCNGQMLDWEEDSVLHQRDARKWRYAAAVAAFALLIGLEALAMGLAELPRYRGELTPETFTANFNRLADYCGLDFGAALQPDGSWEETPAEGQILYLGGNSARPDYTFIETGGVLTAVEFRVETSDRWPPSEQVQMLLCVMAFAGAQKGYGLFAPARKELAGAVTGHPFESFTFEEEGVTASCEVEYRGYDVYGSDGARDLFAQEDADVHYALAFRIALAP